jgi:hypothetical protein
MHRRRARHIFMDPEATQTALEGLRQLVDQLDRPAALGPLEVTIMPPIGLIDADTARRYDDLGVDLPTSMRPPPLASRSAR